MSGKSGKELDIANGVRAVLVHQSQWFSFPKSVLQRHLRNGHVPSFASLFPNTGAVLGA